MGKLVFSTLSNAVYTEGSYGLVVYFNLADKTISVESNNGLFKYSMENPPVSYGQFLLYAWYQVLLGMDGYPVETILEIHNYYLKYEVAYKNYKNKKEISNLPDINYYFSDKSDDNDLLNIVVMSTLIGNQISLMLNIESMKVHILYNGKELIYNLDYLPQKYFKYLQTPVFDILESYIRKFIDENSSSVKYNIILDNWRGLRAKIGV